MTCGGHPEAFTSITTLQGTCPCLPNHSFMTCGHPEAFTSTTIFFKCGEKTSSGGRSGMLHPENSLGVSSPTQLIVKPSPRNISLHHRLQKTISVATITLKLIIKLG